MLHFLSLWWNLLLYGFMFTSGESRRLQRSRIEFCHHTEAGGGREAAHGL